MLQPRPHPLPDFQLDPIWVEITVENQEENQSFIGQVGAPLERSIFAKSADDFVRLDRVRWREDLNEFEFRIVRQEEQGEDYGDTLFIKKSRIIFVCPIRDGSDIWADPDVPPGFEIERVEDLEDEEAICEEPGED